MKARTLVGPMIGRGFYIGHTDHDIHVTLWGSQNVVSIERSALPHPCIRQWGELYRIGGMYWREVPHPFTADPTHAILYKDTLLSALTWPIRWALIPDARGWRRWLRTG